MLCFDEENLPIPVPPPTRGIRPPWAGPPSNVLPAPFGALLLQARSEMAVLAVYGAHACAEGFGVEVLAKWQQSTQPEPVRQGPHFASRGGPNALRFVIRFADGREAIADNRPGHPADPGRQLPRISFRSGQGSDSEWEHRMWVWPLPPPGPLTILCEWPAMAIPETTAVLDASVILDAAAGAATLWTSGGDSPP